MSEAPAGWLRAVDEALVAAHLGTAEGSDDYDTAKRKLDALIEWHVAVATDPAVNGGWQLVPVEPTPEMCDALRADAARYRWAVKSEDNAYALVGSVLLAGTDRSAIDADIDAAMAKEASE